MKRSRKNLLSLQAHMSRFSDLHCIFGQLIRSHANTKMFLWHLGKISNGLQFDAFYHSSDSNKRNLKHFYDYEECPIYWTVYKTIH